jgi:HAMP domain-containing protein
MSLVLQHYRVFAGLNFLSAALLIAARLSHSPRRRRRNNQNQIQNKNLNTKPKIKTEIQNPESKLKNA